VPAEGFGSAAFGSESKDFLFTRQCTGSGPLSGYERNYR
jgi:hypothetical protein